MIKAFALGIAASFFFAFTFVLNQQMSVSGGNWIWSACLRYVFMLPILSVIVFLKKELFYVLKDIKERTFQWIIWSTVGFGIFYAPLSFASAYGASWLVAGTWQITIVAGALMSPLFFKNVQTGAKVTRVRCRAPKKSILMSSVILFGILLMQFEHSKAVSASQLGIGIIPVILAAFAYPLGNRKMIEICKNKFTTFQRVFGMTLCSMPFWFALSSFGIIFDGLPSKGQLIQSLIVAIFSGVIATVLFFKAGDIVGGDTHKMAIIESTQAGEVVFTLLGGIFVFGDKIPNTFGIIGIIFVIVGMISNSLMGSSESK